ncbi:endonuclease [Deferribacter autotrophicus]|uniref:Endonuclease n=1 Tax=Deferribacter autotrophicus TaxID=500465 RepID=A0A5A8F3M1_9BACT|nr:endonuclease [Deferribacter autotrophicus]KAA0257969.1 endonuclease [Deferribacter autotrophicus]
MLNRLYELLFHNYGDLKWWPADTPFEVAVGAILTQNTNWNNVEKAIKNLKEADLLNPYGIFESDENYLKELIRPAGFYNQKCERLKILSEFIIKELKGDILNLKKCGLKEAREKLLTLKGIGKETADSILLYALDFKIFVVDAYTLKLFERLGIGKFSNYDECQEHVHKHFRGDVKLYKNFHALIVEHCKRFCKKYPKCVECFFNSKHCFWVEQIN